MDSAEVAVLLGGIFLIVLTLWFFFGNREEESTPTSNDTVVYACPMHPWITSSDPAATCSICGMKLTQKN
jgi:hypothetical protein